jgi:hypothetical protein
MTNSEAAPLLRYAEELEAEALAIERAEASPDPAPGVRKPKS